MNRPLLAFAGLIAAGGTAVGVYVAVPGGGEEEVAQQFATATPLATEAAVAPVLTPGPGVTLWRWGNVTILVDEKSGISVSRYIAPPQRLPPDGGPEMDLILGESQVGINAVTGAVLYRQVVEKDQALVDGALSTLFVGPLDAAAAQWPHNGELPTGLQRQQWGKIRYVEPSPDAGVIVNRAVGDCFGQPQCTDLDSKFITVTNGSSSATALVKSGNLSTDMSGVKASDNRVFARYLESVVLCESESVC